MSDTTAYLLTATLMILTTFLGRKIPHNRSTFIPLIPQPHRKY